MRLHVKHQCPLMGHFPMQTQHGGVVSAGLTVSLLKDLTAFNLLIDIKSEEKSSLSQNRNIKSEYKQTIDSFPFGNFKHSIT